MAYQKDFRNRYELQLSLTLSVITGLDATHSAHHHPTHHHIYYYYVHSFYFLC